ncbi:MAG: hypothetical protein SF182_15475 [Deltaproteobacteria bacterium]|nr:hypothetical protein [Deltaproteobacteria bacterium]
MQSIRTFILTFARGTREGTGASLAARLLPPRSGRRSGWGPLLTLCLLAAALGARPGAAAETSPPTGSRPPISFTAGAPSVDALIDELLDAIARNDKDAMHRLRVTKDEYLQIIVPGTVEKDQAPRQLTEQPREFFWSLNDRKSRYAADSILARFGGRTPLSHQLRFSRGTTEYLWYTARGQVRLDLTFADAPLPEELRTGTIAEVDGRYKFLAFQWDN